MSSQLNIPNLPPVSDANKIDIQTIGQVIKNTFPKLLSDNPSDDIQYGIILGLLVKLNKLFDAGNNAGTDPLLFNLIMRSFYETSISIRFILNQLDSGVIKEFIIGDAMEYLQRLKSDLKTGVMKKEDFNSAKELLEKNLSYNQLRLTDLPGGYPKSWHPTKSYREMTESLDSTGEALAIYENFYSASSSLAHPSLTDIMRWHVTKFDETSPYIPNMHPMYLSDNSMKVVLYCTTLSTLIDLAISSKNEQLANSLTDIHNKLHINFNDRRDPFIQHTESIKTYANFWLQNYPDEQPIP